MNNDKVSIQHYCFNYKNENHKDIIQKIPFDDYLNHKLDILLRLDHHMLNY